MTFANKIYAIKFLREIFTRAEDVRKPTVETRANEISGGHEVVVTYPYVPKIEVGLKEAKEFVEACMALGVTHHLEEQQKLDTINGYECKTCYIRLNTAREAGLHLASCTTHHIGPYRG
jgi:hypothetical protein